MDPALVEVIASGFLSDDPSKFLGALKVLDEAWFKSRNLQSERVRFARAIQELAIYRQGSIIKKLTKQLLQEQDASEAFNTACLKVANEFFARTCPGQVVTSMLMPHTEDPQNQAVSILVLSRLATSKVVAQVCLTNEEFVEKLARNLQKTIARIEAVSAMSREIICTLQGIANFAHASKLFRQKMQAIHMNLLPAVQKLFSEDYSFLGDEDFFTSKESLARLIETLSLSSDSRVWMFDAGYLQVLTELFRFERPVPNEETDSVTIRCAFSLLRLLESKECLKKMRESDVLSLLKPYSRLLDKHIFQFWIYFEIKLSDDASIRKQFVPSYPGSHPAWKALRRADFAVRTVCSWGVCTALEPESMTAFSKCGRCGVTPYCR